VTRKKWKTVVGAMYETKHPSEKAAYAEVRRLEDSYSAGTNRFNGVVVYVSEDGGRGWSTYERLTFTATAKPTEETQP
jgi:hypothetical protein